MAGQLRAIRQRIRGVQSIAKITRAQELIAASRIIKAQQRSGTPGPTPEITQAVEAVVSQSSQIDHPRWSGSRESAAGRVLILSSDRGFAGGYNGNVMREAQRTAGPAPGARRRAAYLRVRNEGHHVAPVPGRGDALVAWFLGDAPADNAREITEALFEAFNRSAEDGGVDEIHIVFTEFVSMLTQNAVVHRIIPLVIEETTEAPVGGPIPLYEFEPSPQVVLDALLPWYVESRIYQALLEAARIAARRRAMKSATDANDLLEFTREANRPARPRSPRNSEIVGGADAMAESVEGKSGV
jgi:F-type H+-transporting ATPase subunit gamma